MSGFFDFDPYAALKNPNAISLPPNVSNLPNLKDKGTARLGKLAGLGKGMPPSAILEAAESTAKTAAPRQNPETAYRCELFYLGSGKLPVSWPNAGLLPPPGRICCCCGGGRWWSNGTGWCCWKCHPPVEQSIVEEIET